MQKHRWDMKLILMIMIITFATMIMIINKYDTVDDHDIDGDYDKDDLVTVFTGK